MIKNLAVKVNDAGAHSRPSETESPRVLVRQFTIRGTKSYEKPMLGRAALVDVNLCQWMVFPQLQIGARQILNKATPRSEVGDLQGIAGKAMPEIPSLDMPLLEASTASEAKAS